MRKRKSVAMARGIEYSTSMWLSFLPLIPDSFGLVELGNENQELVDQLHK
jgi:hypothetical protein